MSVVEPPAEDNGNAHIRPPQAGYSRRDLLERSSRALVSMFGASAFAHVAGIDILESRSSKPRPTLDVDAAWLKHGGTPQEIQSADAQLRKYSARSSLERTDTNCICACECDCDCVCQCDGFPCSCDCACGCNCNCFCECNCGDNCNCETCECPVENSITTHVTNRDQVFQTDYSNNPTTNSDPGAGTTGSTNWDTNGPNVSANGISNQQTFSATASVGAARTNSARTTGQTSSSQLEVQQDVGVYYTPTSVAWPRLQSLLE